MKVVEKKMPDGRFELTATADVEEVAAALDMAQRMFADRMSLKPDGDKSIAQIAEEQAGIKDLDSLVEADAIEYIYPFAIDKRNIIPAYPPKPMPSGSMKRGKEFTFRLYIKEKPQYELKNYDPVHISIPPFKVETESVVNAQLAQMAEQYCEFVDAEPHTVQADDIVKMALKVMDGDKEMTSLTTDGRTYPLGMKYMPDGFDEGIIGMEVGDTKTFTINVPDYSDAGEPQTKPIECTVTILGQQKKQVATIDDEWVKKYMPWTIGLEMLKESIASEYVRQERRGYDDYVMNMATNCLTSLFDGKIDDEIYEAASKNTLQMLKQNLAQQGMSFEDFVRENGGDQQFQMMLMLQTRQNLVGGFALDAVFRHFKLKAEEHDIMEACAAMNPEDPQGMRRRLEASGRGFLIREMAERMAAQRYVATHAEVTYINADEEAVPEVVAPVAPVAPVAE